MSNPVKIAIAGTGYGRKVALPVYARLDEFQPVGIWSRRAERARSVADDAGLDLGTDDLDELLATPGLEAVHVATPVTTHAYIASAAARRGLHVLCEKPLAATLDDARRVVETVRTAGVVGAVNYGRRFQAPRRRLLDRARDVLGTPRMFSLTAVHSDHAEPDSRPYTWVHDAALGGGRLQAYGVHEFDLVLELCPDIEAVAAATDIGVRARPGDNATMRPVTAEDAFAVLMRPRAGGLVVVSFIATAHHARGEVVELHGDKGTVRLDDERRLWWGGKGEELHCEGPLDASSKDAFAHVARNFYRAIRDGAAPEPSLEHGVRVQALLDAVHTADVERRWVRPEPVTIEGAPQP